MNVNYNLINMKYTDTDFEELANLIDEKITTYTVENQVLKFSRDGKYYDFFWSTKNDMLEIRLRIDEIENTLIRYYPTRHFSCHVYFLHLFWTNATADIHKTTKYIFTDIRYRMLSQNKCRYCKCSVLSPSRHNNTQRHQRNVDIFRLLNM